MLNLQINIWHRIYNKFVILILITGSKFIIKKIRAGNNFYSPDFVINQMRTPSRRGANNPESPQRFNTKCVCQICTCGKHHCPKKHATRFQAQTSYHRDYVGHQTTPLKQEKCKHHYQQRHYDPELMKSTYDQFYTPYKLQPPQAQKKLQYQPRKAQFYDETQYKRNYEPKEITIDNRPRGVCQTKFAPNHGKFEGTTTYDAEFTPKRSDQKNDYNPKTYERRKVPFQGKTMYSTQYVPHQIQPNKITDSKCRNNNYEPRKTRFEGQSAYKHDYPGYVIQPEEKCPILDLPTYPRQCSPGKNHVNFSAEKNRWQ